MVIRESLVLDLSQALAQLDDLERQLDSLLQPIKIPVEIDSEQALDQLQREIRVADAEDIDIDVDTSEVEDADREFEEFRREVDRSEDELQDLEKRAERTGKELQRAGRKGQSGFRGLTSTFLAVGTAIASVAGAREIIQFFGDAIGRASDLEESVSKAGVVFGSFADDIETFARAAPQALGLSTQAALEATATFGNLFVALGLTQQAASDLAPDIVQLGADLASFNNIEVDEALIALRSGLVGEVEPLRRLGVAINAAVVEAKALELGLLGVNGEISEAAKVQARYALILEQTAIAQGDFARTAEGLANTQRTATASFEDFQAAVGEALRTIYEPLLALVPDLISGLELLVPVLANVAEGFASAVPEANALVEALQILSAVPVTLGALAEGLQFLPRLVRGLAHFIFFDFEGGVDNITNAFEGLGRAVEDIKLESLRQGLINALQAGVDPAVALGNVLVELSRLDLGLEEFVDQADRLGAISGLDPDRAQDLANAFRAQGEALGFEATEITRFLIPLERIIGLRGRETTAINDNLDLVRERTRQASFASAATLNEAQALEILAAAAEEAGVSTGELLADAEQLPDALQLVAASVDESTVAFLQQLDAIDAIGDEFRALSGDLEAAGRALEDEEGKIIDDFSVFLANLQAELEAVAAFESNLAILRTFGLANLAEVFEQAGIEAAGALADAVANPEEAREAERLLTGVATSQAQVYADAFGTALENSSLTQDAIDTLTEAAEAANSAPVQAALIAAAEDLALLFAANFNPELLISEFNISFPADVIAANIEAGGGGLGSVEVNIINPTTQDLNTDSARAAAEIGSVINFGAQ